MCRPFNVSMEYEEQAIKTEDWSAVLIRFDNGAHGLFCTSRVSAGRKCRLDFEIDGSKSSMYRNQETPDQMWEGFRERQNSIVMRKPLMMSPASQTEGWNDALRNNIYSYYTYIRGIFKEVLRQGMTLIKGVKEVSILFWIAEGSDILEWRGNPEEEIELARYIGYMNDEDNNRQDQVGNPVCGRNHIDDPPVMTCRYVKEIISTFKRRRWMIMEYNYWKAIDPKRFDLPAFTRAYKKEAFSFYHTVLLSDKQSFDHFHSTKETEGKCRRIRGICGARQTIKSYLWINRIVLFVLCNDH